MTDSAKQPSAPNWRTIILFLTVIGLAAALAGGVYLSSETGRLRNEMSELRAEARNLNARLNETAAGLDAARQQFEALAGQINDVNQKAGTALERARAEARLRAAQQDEQRRAHDEMASEVAELKQTTSAVSSDVNNVKTDVSGVKTDVSGVKTDVHGVRSDVDKTAADLRKVTGDLGVMSGLIATNAKQLTALRKLGERDYYEFGLAKSHVPQKVGDIRLLLKKADPKHSRYTLTIYADDRRVEKKDRTINEPVQLYVGGSRQPYEIVVNEVRKDKVVGYLASPKTDVARK